MEKSRNYRRPASSNSTIIRNTNARIGEGITCQLDTGRATTETGPHQAICSDDQSLRSGDMFLIALVACARVRLATVATDFAVKLDYASFSIEVDLDYRYTLGVSKETPVGFKIFD